MEVPTFGYWMGSYGPLCQPSQRQRTRPVRVVGVKDFEVDRLVKPVRIAKGGEKRGETLKWHALERVGVSGVPVTGRFSSYSSVKERTSLVAGPLSWGRPVGVSGVEVC